MNFNAVDRPSRQALHASITDLALLQPDAHGGIDEEVVREAKQIEYEGVPALVSAGIHHCHDQRNEPLGRGIVLGLDFRTKKFHNRFVKRHKQNEETADSHHARASRAERSS